MKQLIVAPHADDEVLGCGGIIARDSENTAVIVLADKGDGRTSELAASQWVLGYTTLIEPEFLTGKLSENQRAVTSLLDTVISSLKPEQVYLPTPGTHPDHLATYQAGLAAARKSYSAHNWFVPGVFLYDIPSYSVETFTIPYGWSRYVELTPDQMDLKCKAIDAYGSQSNGSFSPSRLARDHAERIGAQANLRYAEQFAVVRDVIT